MKKKLIISLGLAAALLIGGLWLASRVNLSALEEPGHFETYTATKAKRWLIGRAARGVPAAPVWDAASVKMGGMQFRADCAACHGSDGRSPTDIGQWMSPRAPDLGAPEAQAWSDPELFWIIQHGVKMTGMPGFGRQYDEARIWQLVHYVREIAKQPPSQPR